MTAFNIENYLDSLQEDIETIVVSNENLTYLPSLKRFYKLTSLYCNNNQLTMLPKLNDSLQKLHCYNNQLIIIPELNNSLQYLICSNNQLIELPELNDSLKTLYCSNNQLTMLPELNDSLRELICYNNQLPYKLICNDYLHFERKNEMNKIIHLLKRVKFNIMCLKYKKKFRDWLWIKVKLPKIQSKYHPNNLIVLLENVEENDDDTLYDAIEKW